MKCKLKRCHAVAAALMKLMRDTEVMYKDSFQYPNDKKNWRKAWKKADSPSHDAHEKAWNALKAAGYDTSKFRRP